MLNGPGSLVPGPCTYTVAAPSRALAGPSFSSVTRMTCKGRCVVPTNRSVDSTPAIRMISVSRVQTTPRDPPAHGGGARLARSGESPREGPRGGGRIVSLGDGPDDDHPGGSG